MKTKVTKFLKVFLIGLMLRWFLYFAISLNNTSLMSLDQLLDVCPSYCGITNYFTTSEKKVFKISEIFWVLERVSQFATRLMLSFLILLFVKKASSSSRKFYYQQSFSSFLTWFSHYKLFYLLQIYSSKSYSLFLSLFHNTLKNSFFKKGLLLVLVSKFSFQWSRFVQCSITNTQKKNLVLECFPIYYTLCFLSVFYNLRS